MLKSDALKDSGIGKKAPDYQESIYKKFLESRDQDLLWEVIDFEKAGLDDYLLRMTGSLDLTRKTFLELKSAMKYDIVRRFQFEDFRVKLFMTARSFCGEYWNSNTSLLEVSLFLKNPKADDLSLTLQKSLMAIPGRHKEAILLSGSYGFSEKQAARVQGISDKLYLKNLSEAYASWQQHLQSQSASQPKTPKGLDLPRAAKEIQKLTLPSQISRSHFTELGQVVDSLRKGKPSTLKILVVLSFLSAAAFAYWHLLRP